MLKCTSFLSIRQGVPEKTLSLVKSFEEDARPRDTAKCSDSLLEVLFHICAQALTSKPIRSVFSDNTRAVSYIALN